MKEIEIKQACRSCRATGLYQGMAERNGAAIVCYDCGGTGCNIFIHEYEDFEGRKERKDVARVYRVNPGIGIGESNGYKLEDFGGMPFADWRKGKPFPAKTEMRSFTCPAWWYQTADYDKKPNWQECNGVGSFSNCKHFKQKHKCWERFDKENL